MRFKKTALALLVSLLIAALVGAVPFMIKLATTYDVEVRTKPWRTQAGRITEAYPIGQGFRPDWNGLDRIDVALVVFGPSEGEQLELLLRRDTRDGEIIRRAPMAPDALTEGRGWVSFEFERVEDSAGRDFWFEFAIPGEKRRSAYSPWIRYQGHPGEDTPWGNKILRGPVIEGLLADHSPRGKELQTHAYLPAPNLSAVAIAMDTLQPSRGPVRLDIWPDGSDPNTTPPLRSTTLGPEEEVHGGYAFFTFELIEESRHKRWYYRLTLNAAARVVGFEKDVSLKTFHGGPEGQAPLLGMNRGAVTHHDRNLIFRAHSTPSRTQVLQRIRDRSDWKLEAGALCWILSIFLVVRLFVVRGS